MSSSQFRRSKRRFDDDESTFLKRDRHRRRLPPADFGSETFGLPEGDRWSTWDQSAPTERGPQPHPDWLVTDLAAVDTELGILKTGKEAGVFLLRRGVPGTGRYCLLAAKRYRAAEHRMFQRDSEYLEGRRVRESRVNRAIAARSAAGRAMISTQWARAEFAALSQLCAAGLPVPYPVQILQTELLLEFIGEPDGTAAPRLAEIRPAGAELASLGPAGGCPVRPGPARLRARRPVGLQPAGARQPAGHDRHAADRRPDREPARRGVLDQGLGERRALVHRPRADRSDAGAGRPGRPAASRSTLVIAGTSADFLLSA